MVDWQKESYTSVELAERLGEKHGIILNLIKSWVRKDSEKYKYTQQEYEWRTNRWAKLFIISGSFARELATRKKPIRWNMTKVWEYIHLHSLELMPLSTKYMGKPMMWKCTHKDCYHEWPVTWSHIVNDNSHCPKCAGKYAWTWELIIKELSKNKYKNIQLQNTTFMVPFDRNAILSWRCAVPNCNYTWETKWNNVYRHPHCDRCLNREPVTMELIHRKKHLINTGIEIVSKECHGNEDLLECKCLKDASHPNYFVTWTNLQRGHGCKKCNICNEGFYNPTVAERNKATWLLREARVYFISCVLNGESFYKIGVTVDKTNQRMWKGSMPYPYTIVDEIITNRYEAMYIEKALHNLHRAFRYEPLLYFQGHTECFTQLISYTQEELDNEVKELKIKHKPKK